MTQAINFAKRKGEIWTEIIRDVKLPRSENAEDMELWFLNQTVHTVQR
jgi:hypothetical protein